MLKLTFSAQKIPKMLYKTVRFLSRIEITKYKYRPDYKQLCILK